MAIFNGGPGNELIIGSNQDDTLRGGHGNDTIVGNKGDDIMLGDAGNDRLIWNNGDGSDLMRGGRGYDVTRVNGAVDAGDNFELRGKGGIAEFERRNLGNFTLNVDDVERFEVNGIGGDDTLTVRDLSATDVQKVVFLGGRGDDLLNATDAGVSVAAYGGAGHDTLLGSSQDDLLAGGDGNNIYTGGKGADIFVVGFDGIDVINDFNVREDIVRLSRTEFGASSLNQFQYNSNSGSLSYQGTQFATIQTTRFDPSLNIDLV